MGKATDYGVGYPLFKWFCIVYVRFLLSFTVRKFILNIFNADGDSDLPAA